jgi:hypothetical protein
MSPKRKRFVRCYMELQPPYRGSALAAARMAGFGRSRNMASGPSSNLIMAKIAWRLMCDANVVDAIHKAGGITILPVRREINKELGATVCPHCQKVFAKMHWQRVYCSKQCRLESSRSREFLAKLARPLLAKTCAACMAMFECRGTKKVCSWECGVALRRRNYRKGARLAFEKQRAARDALKQLGIKARMRYARRAVEGLGITIGES